MIKRLLLIALCLISASPGTLAISGGDFKSLIFDSVYYNEEDQPARCAVGGGGTTPLTGGDTTEQAYNYYIGKGLEPIHAAGIVGNFIVESGSDPIDPTAENGRGAYGIAQWLGGRRTNLENFANTAGRDPAALDTQLDFSWEELQGSEANSLNKLQATTTVEDAAIAWEKFYERSGGALVAERVNNAQAVLDRYGGGGGSDTGPPVAGSSGCGGQGVSADGFVFPLLTTQQKVTDGITGSKWCTTSQENCHHNYNAADIFVETGTPVVAARPGTVVSAKDVATNPSPVGSRVTIKGDDGFVYYYAHMGADSLTVSEGDIVTAGQQLGAVGTNANAVGTPRHLHFDILPPEYNDRMSCSSASCSGYPFVNVQPPLTESFSKLPPS